MHETALFGDDKGALKLTDVLGVNAEVGLQGHLHMDTLGHIHETASAPNSRDQGQGSEFVVRRGNYGAEVFPHNVGILPHRRVHVHEDDAHALQVFTDTVIYHLRIILCPT